MIVPIICTVSISDHSSKQMVLKNGFQAPTDRLQAPTARQRQPLVPTPIVHDAQRPGWVPLLCTIQGKVVLVRVPRWRHDPLVYYLKLRNKYIKCIGHVDLFHILINEIRLNFEVWISMGLIGYTRVRSLLPLDGVSGFPGLKSTCLHTAFMRRQILCYLQSSLDTTRTNGKSACILSSWVTFKCQVVQLFSTRLST